MNNKFGTKHRCWECGTKFYDMNKPVPVCPKCGTDQSARYSEEEPSVLTDDDLEDAVGRVFDDDQSLPGNLDLEVGGLDGDDDNLPIMADDLDEDLDED